MQNLENLLEKGHPTDYSVEDRSCCAAMIARTYGDGNLLRFWRHLVHSERPFLEAFRSAWSEAPILTVPGRIVTWPYGPA